METPLNNIASENQDSRRTVVSNILLGATIGGLSCGYLGMIFSALAEKIFLALTNPNLDLLTIIRKCTKASRK